MLKFGDWVYKDSKIGRIIWLQQGISEENAKDSRVRIRTLTEGGAVEDFDALYKECVSVVPQIAVFDNTVASSIPGALEAGFGG